MNKLIIAHRGASSRKRENTLEAFQEAVDLGADWIEFDVRRTRDGRLVIHHDPQIAGIPLSRIADSELPSITGRLGYRVPDVAEVLALAKGKLGLDIELKEDGFEQDVLDLLDQAAWDGPLVLSSFSLAAIERVKRIRPDVETGLIFKTRSAWAGMPEGVADWMIMEKRLARDGDLNRFRHAGKKIAVWTVNDRDEIRAFLEDDRIDGIITDIPDAAIALRRSA